MKEVVRFGKNRKLCPRYVGPYENLQKIGKVAYEVKLTSEFALVHPVFHVSMLKKCIGNPESILPIEGLGVTVNLSYEEVLVQIPDREVKRIMYKEVVSVKVLWENHLVKGATWEDKADIPENYMPIKQPNEIN
ncbi:uncharacterized protein [Solanum lycopersicum]|uniref:uncharacterized protein n=1 Tax=Solanum lycopersicum TaxID=4081 RepID=UPI003748A348